VDTFPVGTWVAIVKEDPGVALTASRLGNFGVVIRDSGDVVVVHLAKPILGHQTVAVATDKLVVLPRGSVLRDEWVRRHVQEAL
jgi:hypothetical protein